MITKFKKVILKNKFFKKPSIEIPEDLLTKCAPAGNTSKDKIIYIGTETGLMEVRAILPSVNESLKENEIISLTNDGDEVIYKEVTGFFSFRGDKFYRVKGAAGKSIKDNKSFTDFLKEKYPEEFCKCKVSDISTLKVQPLKVI